MYTVSVIMSTYNGERYVGAQIDSILRQKDVKINLYVRDDGSMDGTVDILKLYSERYPNIQYIVGKNMGFSQSFLTALDSAPVADYYAFSDQDDIWDDDKLIKTIRLFPKGKKCVLGFLNAQETNESMEITNVLYKDNRMLPPRCMSYIMPVGHGFLMVFDEKIREYALKDRENIPISYDMWVGVIAYYLGEIYWDKHIVALHRRLPTSLSGKKRILTLKNRIKSILYDRGVYIKCSRILLNNFYDKLEDNEIKELNTFVNYRISLVDKMNLLIDKKMSYGGIWGYVAIKLKILLNRL